MLKISMKPLDEKSFHHIVPNGQGRTSLYITFMFV